MTRVLATIALVAGCWVVWEYSPIALGFFGLDDLDIPGRVCAIFLFLTLADLLAARLRKT